MKVIVKLISPFGLWSDLALSNELTNPVIEPLTPGIQGELLNHYDTVADVQYMKRTRTELTTHY